ncbi:MAG: type II toxin-antitoxin system RatA family toxin [Pseudomonadota bacterium]
MTRRRTRTHVPYSAEAMFDLVADVARYPEFIPHCLALRVIADESRDGQGVITADMLVAYKVFREKFRSRARLDRAGGLIDVDYVNGPFRRLETIWRFENDADGSIIDFEIDFEFSNFVMQATAAGVFERAFEKMADAFVARAHDVYGERAVV